MLSRIPLLALAAAAILPVLIFGGVMVVRLDDYQRSTIEQTLRQSARSAIHAVDHRLSDHLTALKALAASPSLDAGDIDEFRDHADRVLRTEPYWQSVRLTNARTYDPVFAVTSTDIPLPPPSPLALQELGHITRTQQPLIGDVRRVPGLDEPVIVLRVPVIRNGSVVYVLSAAVSARAFSETLVGQSIPSGWVAAVLDRDYHIVGRSRAQEEFVGTRATPTLTDEIDKATENFFFALNKEGERVYSAFTRSADSGWTVAVGVPAAVVEAPIRRALLISIVGGAGAVLLAVLLVAITIRNIVRRQTAERQLAAEKRLSDIARNFPGVIYRRTLQPDGRIRYPYVSAGVGALIGQPADTAGNRDPVADLIAAIVPEDRALWYKTVLRTAAALTPLDVEGRLRHRDGSIRWVRDTANPRREPDGTVVWDGVLLDITEHRRAEDHQRMLMAEIDHRSKNMLAIVQAMIRQTSRAAASVEELSASLIGRVQALARTHELLSRGRWEGVDLEALIVSSVQSCLDDGGDDIRIAGPHVVLQPAAASVLGLIFYELATNAVKYGALSRTGGSIAVTWTLNAAAGAGAGAGTPALHLRWAEHGGPAVREPTRTGFGTTMIRRSLSHQLGGSTRLDFAPEGLLCELVIPGDKLARLPQETAQVAD